MLENNSMCAPHHMPNHSNAQCSRRDRRLATHSNWINLSKFIRCAVTPISLCIESTSTRKKGKRNEAKSEFMSICVINEFYLFNCRHSTRQICAHLLRGRYVSSKKKKTNRSAGETGFPILNIDKTRETLLHSNASANSRVCMCSTPRLTSSPKTCKIYALLRHWKIRADIYCLPLVRSSHFFFLWMLMENFVNAGTLFTCYRTSPHCKIYN